jgi:NAD/NADP transhydrogenase beta subunit
MATLAGGCTMFAEEGIFRIAIMIKGNRFPVVLAMTFLAFLTKIRPVDIVFLVARIAVGRRLIFVERTFVASVAFRLSVVAFEKVRGITIMLKEQGFPVTLGVTALALLAETALMLVVLLMAGVAVDRSLVLI